MVRLDVNLFWGIYVTGRRESLRVHEGRVEYTTRVLRVKRERRGNESSCASGALLQSAYFTEKSTKDTLSDVSRRYCVQWNLRFNRE